MQPRPDSDPLICCAFQPCSSLNMCGVPFAVAGVGSYEAWGGSL